MISLPTWITSALPFLITLTLGTTALWALARWQNHHQLANRDARLPRQLLTLGAYAFATMLLLLTMPVSDTTRGQLLSFMGLIITALIALSSTTLVANAMAGLLLRIVDSFEPGDFIRVGDSFGRVTERSLFHTEIQTEDRDLMTLPNMHLITNPVTVVHDNGTIISASLSLGYEIHHAQIEALLKDAALTAGLHDPFVQVRELGDFSVVYRICGRLEEVNSLLTARSNLRREVLDAMHGAQIEIVSPSFMNQRPQDPSVRHIPKVWRAKGEGGEDASPSVEEMVFDKAEQASQTAQKTAKIDALRKELETLKAGKDETKLPVIETLQADIKALEEEQLENPEDADKPSTP